jgi:hypothetical protein
VDTKTSNFTRDERGVLKGSTGAPVNDGSEAFNELLISRIEKADKRIGVIPVSRMREELERRRDLRHGRVQR